jgi:hypothetical protein
MISVSVDSARVNELLVMRANHEAVDVLGTQRFSEIRDALFWPVFDSVDEQVGWALGNVLRRLYDGRKAEQ